MPRDLEKNLVQIQVPPALREKLEGLAKMDRRSLVSECLRLIEEGMKRREIMLRLIDRDERKRRPPTSRSKEAAV